MDSRAYCVKLLDRAEVPIDSPEPWSLHVHDERLWDRLLRDRELGMGESYMDGWWSCDRLDELLTRVLSVDAASGLKVTPRLIAHVLTSRLRNHQTVRRAKRNASAHYDIGNDLYEQMLDKRMIYSCAYWRSANDLDSAQEAKLDLICRKLNLEPGMRMLDIGCGWGALAQYAAEHYGVQVVGISPAAEQVKIARERCSGLPVDIRQEDYRHVAGRFDRITSVGMMEHVGPRNLETFFESCDRLLAPGGMMLHHTIGSTISKNHTDAFFDKYVFPGGVLPSLAQISLAVEKRFVIEDVHNLGPDYDRTLMAWQSNIDDAWDRLPPGRYDERFRRMWHYYLMASAAGFRVHNLQLWQVVFRRTGVAERYDAPR